MLAIVESWFNVAGAILSILIALGTGLTALFIIGKALGTAAERFESALKTAVEIFELRLTEVIKDINELKEANKELTQEIKEISVHQISDLKERQIKTESRTEAMFCKIDDHEQRLNNIEGLK